jgi:hypothetical protein
MQVLLELQSTADGFQIFPYTECNRIRYTTLKIYCDQTNDNITTRFLTEHLLTLQFFFTSVQYGCH